MDRKRFLKLFGLGCAGIATAKIIANEVKAVDTSKYIIGCDPYNIKDKSYGVIISNSTHQAIIDNYWERNWIIKTNEYRMKEFHNTMIEFAKHYKMK